MSPPEIQSVIFLCMYALAMVCMGLAESRRQRSEQALIVALERLVSLAYMIKDEAVMAYIGRAIDSILKQVDKEKSAKVLAKEEVKNFLDKMGITVKEKEK